MICLGVRFWGKLGGEREKMTLLKKKLYNIYIKKNIGHQIDINQLLCLVII